MEFLFISFQFDPTIYAYHDVDTLPNSIIPSTIPTSYTYPEFPESVTISNFGGNVNTIEFYKHSFLSIDHVVTLYIDSQMPLPLEKIRYILDYLRNHLNSSIEELNSLGSFN